MTDAGPKPEQKLEEEIIVEVVKKAEKVSKRQMYKEIDRAYQTINQNYQYENWQNKDDTVNEEFPIWRIVYGGKIYFLASEECVSSEFDYKPATTFRGNIIINLDKPDHTPGETTIIFKAAKQIMKNFSKKFKGPCFYHFWTENLNMARWVLKEGSKIFNWREQTYQKVNGTNTTPSNEEEIREMLSNPNTKNGDIRIKSEALFYDEPKNQKSEI